MSSVKTPQDVLSMCRQHDVKAVSFRYTDFLGNWQQKTIPVARLGEDTFEDGVTSCAFEIQCPGEGHTMWLPQPETAFLEPFSELPTINLICNAQDTLAFDSYAFDPRQIALNAVGYLSQSGYADEARIGCEIEFFVLGEGACREAFDLRNEIMQRLIDVGVNVHSHCQASRNANHCALELQHTDLASIADRVMVTRQFCETVASRRGYQTLFVAEPNVECDLRLITCLSLWKDGHALFAGAGYAGLSEMGLYAIGGILRHARAIAAFSGSHPIGNPKLAQNQSRSLLTYGQDASQAVCRIPPDSPDPKSRRIEFRNSDSDSHCYWTFTSILMAAIDGIENRIDPGPAFDAANTGFETLSPSKNEALESLTTDRDFLLRGGVLSDAVLDHWIALQGSAPA